MISIEKIILDEEIKESALYSKGKGMSSWTLRMGCSCYDSCGSCRPAWVSPFVKGAVGLLSTHSFGPYRLMTSG